MSALAPVRLLRTLRLDKVAVRLADGFRLRRGREGRPSFPFVRRAERPSFQVLAYHRVNDEGANFFPGVPLAAFRRQMEAVSRHATVLPLGELMERAERGDLPPRCVAITFDDGYRDNFECAYPVLREFRLPATIFLATGAIETGTRLWHDRVFDAFERAAVDTLAFRGRSLPMAPLAARRLTLREVLTLLRTLRPEERDRMIDDVERQAGTGTSDTDGRMLSWEQIRQMAGAGVTFGAHTVSHPILTRLTLEEADAEIRSSRAAIEARLGTRVDLFAYPNGTRADFNEAIQGLLRDQGFRCAVTTLWGVNDAASNPFELRRVGFWDTAPEEIPLRLAWYRFRG